MPELPEVEVITRQLQEVAAGKTIKACRVLRGNVIAGGGTESEKIRAFKKIQGLKIMKAVRRAKLIIFSLSGGSFMTTHLRMTGKYVYNEKETPPHPHDRVIFTMNDGSCLHYNDSRTLGKLALLPSQAALDAALSKLGVEPLSAEFASFPLYESLHSKKVSAKTFFMDARNIVGLGNIYVSELLHRAGVSPVRRTDRIGKSKAKLLKSLIPELLNEALEKNGTTISDFRRVDEKTGGFQDFLRVYGKKGQPCPKCGTPIQRIVQQQRSSFYCPACQK